MHNVWEQMSYSLHYNTNDIEVLLLFNLSDILLIIC